MMYPPAYMWTGPHHPYQPWPYTAVPHQYHGCCNPTFHGGCPYSFTPPPPFHPHGMYSPFPAAYSLPPPHYSVDQPRYDYDKNNHHCCHHVDAKRPGVKEYPQVDDKTSDSLVPLVLKGRPDYPVMWVPRDYIEPKANDKAKYSHEPVSLKHLEPSKQGASSEVAQDEQGNRFPFQVFWLPSKNDQVTNENNFDLVDNKGLSDENTMKKNQGECDTNAVQKVIPVSKNEETNSKHPVPKVIPVKQASRNEATKNPKGVDANSDSADKTDNGSRASPKTSKLPPVCLRIDPLPRKKKSSRSPSPGKKESSSGLTVNSPKASQQQSQGKDEQSEGNSKVVDHANKVERANLPDHGDVPREKGDESEKGKAEDKKNMSEHEAALIIQSAYRSFEVRKSQPLKKLRQINEVRKLVFDLRSRIQDLEPSSSTISLDHKKATIIGETIMSLLLKLDTIQGLHPFVREVRKSVAKELVGLQEKLDSLASVKSENPSEGTMCGPQQVMHPEDDGKLDQAQAQTGLCENHEQKDTDLEQQSEKSTEDDAVQDKFDQAPTESSTVLCENHQVEATVSQEGCKTIGEPQLDTHKVKFHQASTECDEALGLCEDLEVEATESEVCDIVGEPQLRSHKEKFDQAPSECDEALGLCESHEVKAAESQEGCNTSGEPQLEAPKETSDQAPTESDEALELQEGGKGIGEPQLESPKEKSDLAPTGWEQGLRLDKENNEVEGPESQEGCDTIGEPQLESCKEKFDQEPNEYYEALGLHKENDEVESPEGRVGELQLESHKESSDLASGECDDACEECKIQLELPREKPDEAASEFEDLGLCGVEATDDNGGVEDDDMKLKEDINKKQLEMVGEGEDLVNVESKMHDCDDKNVVESGNVGNEGDGKQQVMAENEKLRGAVEELMRSGNEQLSVIRELTGRVKDLEKRLSKKKKKKIKVNKCRRSRDCVV